MDPSRVMSWLGGWLGFLLLILTGILLLVLGLVGKHPADIQAGYLITAACAIVVGAFSWIVGGVSRVKGRVGDIGVLVEIRDLPWWGWVVDGALVAAAFVSLLIVRA